MQNIVDLLEKRGLLDAVTTETLREYVQEPRVVYCGFDPTSDSLHLGNMVAIMGLAWFQRLGHTPVAIIGGATGMIGDPSGKSHERQLLDEETIEKNLKGIKKNLEAVLDFNHPTCKPIILNNYDWMQKFSFIEFLRDVGKHFRIGSMLAKESVKARLESEEGMSFTEFSYQLLQAYDFLHLFNAYNVTIQVGGSDQWGNITAGKDLIRKLRGQSAHGLTFPLLTTSDGKKFGKSEKGAIWMSPEKLSYYEFYQYLVRVSDADVIRLMRMLTFMDIEEIEAIEKSMQQQDYVPNTAQKRLAEEVTRCVHGEEGLQTALRVTEAAKPGAETVLDREALEAIAADMPSCRLSLREVKDCPLLDVLVTVQMVKSKGEARRLIRGGGVSINNSKIDDENYSLTEQDLIDGQLLLLAIGKKNKVLVRIFSEK